MADAPAPGSVVVSDWHRCKDSKEYFNKILNKKRRKNFGRIKNLLINTPQCNTWLYSSPGIQIEVNRVLNMFEYLYAYIHTLLMYWHYHIFGWFNNFDHLDLETNKVISWKVWENICILNQASPKERNTIGHFKMCFQACWSLQWCPPMQLWTRFIIRSSSLERVESVKLLWLLDSQAWVSHLCTTRQQVGHRLLNQCDLVEYF